MCRKQRSINGRPVLSVPQEVVSEWKSRFKRKGKPFFRTELLEHSDYDIVATYGVEFQGYVNYYKLAHNVAKKLYPVKWLCTQSLVKTLAHKHKRSAKWVYRKYNRKMKNGVTAFVVEVPRDGKKPLIAKFGATPIRYDARADISDQKAKLLPSRNELVKRLLADQCELCNSTINVQVHHVHKLKDMQRRYKGRPNPPRWVVRMMEIRRKTLVVCGQCHHDIHAGTYDGSKLK